MASDLGDCTELPGNSQRGWLCSPLQAAWTHPWDVCPGKHCSDLRELLQKRELQKPPLRWFQADEQAAGNPNIIRQCSYVLFFACVCVCSCVCVCVSMLVGVHTLVSVWRPKAGTECLSRLLPALFSEAGTRWTQNSSVPYLPSQVLGGRMDFHAGLEFMTSVGSGDLNTGPHIYTASTLPTKSSPQPALNFLMFICLYYVILYIICCYVYIM